MVQLPYNKKGDIAWDYIAAIIVALMIFLVVMLFSTTLREKITEGITYFFTGLLGR
jgi:hypothetical protein